MNVSNATDFVLTKVWIYPHNNPKKAKPITALVNVFEYVENITYPFLSAKLNVVDSAGLLNSLPIQGGEKVIVGIESKTFEVKQEYEFRIWTIANRFAQQKKQVYDLGLISVEALHNEINRVSKPLSGNPESIIIDLLKNVLNSQKEVFAEPSKFETKIVPNRQRPFDLIENLSLRSVSVKSNYTTTSTSNTSNEQRVQGTAGFFFWETKRGYNFYSVDSLCADKDSDLKSDKLDATAWGKYVERLGNQEDGDTRFQILESNFDSEVDLIGSLRKGKYSSTIVFFNHSTGAYEEYVYKIKDSYDNMAHLGGQEGITLIPTSEIELSDYPSRLMSIFLDHETWYNESTPASPDPKDGSTSPSKFADWQKFYAAQSLARYQLLKNQICTVVIPGNPDICAGDKIDIRLLNKVPQNEGKDEPYDTESSGVYLIGEVAHNYDTTVGPGGKFLTTLRLMRDSYGLTDRPSQHGTK